MAKIPAAFLIPTQVAKFRKIMKRITLYTLPPLREAPILAS